MQFFRFTAFFLVISLNLQGQGRDYQGPDDPAGDPSAERSGYMTGNRVLIFFKNTTELSDWPASNASKWPNNTEGLKMVDGIGLLVGAIIGGVIGNLMGWMLPEGVVKDFFLT